MRLDHRRLVLLVGVPGHDLWRLPLADSEGTLRGDDVRISKMASPPLVKSAQARWISFPDGTFDFDFADDNTLEEEEAGEKCRGFN
ncbi:hypothetical protein GYH30_003093 [Glycine max]|nr:hypothetical protein GYH30_003093 [Glycine max]